MARRMKEGERGEEVEVDGVEDDWMRENEEEVAAVEAMTVQYT